jgi:hypothetical protein
VLALRLSYPADRDRSVTEQQPTAIRSTVVTFEESARTEAQERSQERNAFTSAGVLLYPRVSISTTGRST